MFLNTYKFCNNDNNKFILLLRKGLYSHEYIDSWERFNETTLPFNSELNLENITDEDCIHAQNVFQELKIESLGGYDDLYDRLVLADVFENFRNKCIEIYELAPVHFLPAPGLACQACLKKTGVK